jgi:hypothetical protein
VLEESVLVEIMAVNEQALTNHEDKKTGERVLPLASYEL